MNLTFIEWTQLQSTVRCGWFIILPRDADVKRSNKTKFVVIEHLTNKNKQLLTNKDVIVNRRLFWKCQNVHIESVNCVSKCKFKDQNCSAFNCLECNQIPNARTCLVRTSAKVAKSDLCCEIERIVKTKVNSMTIQLKQNIVLWHGEILTRFGKYPIVETLMKFSCKVSRI